MKVKSKILSMLLACAMVLSLFPTTTALAATTEHTQHAYKTFVKIMSNGDCKTGAAGIAKYKCSYDGCSKTAYESIDALHTSSGTTPNQTLSSGTLRCPGETGVTSPFKCSACEKENVTNIVYNATGVHVEAGTAEADKTLATCTENEKTGGACKYCGATMGTVVEIPGTALGHDYQMTPIEEGDCSKPGKQQMICARCGAKEGEPQEYGGNGHHWVNDITAEDRGFLDADCVNPARQKQKCDVCGATRENPIMIGGELLTPALGHLPAAGAEPTKISATCESPAYIVYAACTRENCPEKDNTQKKEIDKSVNNGEPLGHIKKSVVTAPTCKDPGYTTVTCTRTKASDGTALTTTCDYNEEIEPTPVDPTAHKVDTSTNGGSKVLTEANCVTRTNGVYKAVCEYCHNSIGYRTVAYTHDFPTSITDLTEGTDYTVKTAGGCTTDAVYVVRCKKEVAGENEAESSPTTIRCDGTTEITEETTGHTWVNEYTPEGGTKVTGTPDDDGWFMATTGGCGGGLMVRKCNTPGCEFNKWEEKTIEGTGTHDFSKEVDEPATCEHGRQVGTVCSVCGAENPDDPLTEITAPVAHHYIDDAENTVAATCTEDGVKAEKCEWCEDPRTTDLPATGHEVADDAEEDDENYVYDKGTCETPAKMTYTCIHCGKVIVDEEIPGTGNGTHTWTETVIPANCNGPKTVKRHCDICGADAEDETTGVADPSNHLWEDTVVTPASCKEEKTGVVLRVCPNCKTRKYTSIPYEHNKPAGTLQWEDADCENPKTATYKCYGDGDTNGHDVKLTEGKALGHNWGEWEVVTPATCGTDGEMKRTCKGHDSNACEYGGVDSEDGTGKLPAEETKVVEADGDHDFQPIKDGEAKEGNPTIIPATCTTSAKEAAWKCTKCGAGDPAHPGLDLGETQPATGHTWTVWVPMSGTYMNSDGDTVPNAPTCGTAGKEILSCKDCHREAYLSTTDNDFGIKANTLNDYIRDAKATGEHTLPETGVKTTPATCNAPAKVEYQCTVCKQNVVDTYDEPTGEHVWTKKPTNALTDAEKDDDGYYKTVQETCYSLGEKVRICDTCKKTETVVIPMLDHGNFKTTVIPMTCVSDGYTVKTCGNTKGSGVCGAEVGERTNVIERDPDAHSFEQDGGKDKIYVMQAADCHTRGTGYKLCEKCNEKVWVPIEVTHNWDKDTASTNTANTKPVIKEDATCTIPGVITYTCKICGDKTDEELKAKGHAATFTKDTKESKDADCGHEGLLVEYCPNCKGEEEGGITRTVTPKTGTHSWNTQNKPATCTEPERKGCYCTVCLIEDPNNPLTDVIGGDPAKGHVWDRAGATSDGWGVDTTRCEDDVAFTCEKDGHESRKCTDCNKMETRTVPAHHIEVENFIPATCTEPSYNQIKCSKCNMTVSTKKTGEPLGHNPADIGQEPTCTKDGWSEKVCQRAGCTYKTERTVVEATGHEWTTETVREATCSKEGIKSKYCKKCGEPDADEPYVTIPTSSHDWETKYRDDGETKYLKCKVCGAEKEDTVDPATCEHKWVYDETKADASEKHYCSVCKVTSEAHEYEETNRYSSKEEDDDGELVTVTTIEYTCKGCGHKKTETAAAGASDPVVDEPVQPVEPVDPEDPETEEPAIEEPVDPEEPEIEEPEQPEIEEPEQPEIEEPEIEESVEEIPEE